MLSADAERQQAHAEREHAGRQAKDVADPDEQQEQHAERVAVVTPERVLDACEDSARVQRARSHSARLRVAARLATAPEMTLTIVRKNSHGLGADGAMSARSRAGNTSRSAIGTTWPAARAHGRAVPIRKSISPPPRSWSP